MSRFQFSLRAGFVAVSCACVFVAIVSSEIRREAREVRLVAKIESSGGQALTKRACWGYGYRYIDHIIIVDMNVTDDWLKEIGACKYLSSLQITGCNVSGDVASLAKCTQLKSLNLAGSRGEFAGLAEVCEHTSLRTLWLTESKPTDDQLEFLRLGKQLRELRIWNMRLSDRTVDNISTCHELEFLELSHVGLGDADMRKLAELHRIEWLIVPNNNLTGKVVDSLKRLTSARQIDIRGNGLSEDDAARLRELLPGCDVVAK